jgi:hypothetical protein
MSGTITSGSQPRAVVLTQIRKPKRSEAIFRIVIVAVLLGSLALAWWAFSVRFVPVQKQARDLSATVSRLSTEVDGFERRWSKEDGEEIRARYQELHTQLFADTAALQAWLTRLEDMAKPLSLSPETEWDKAVPQLTNDYRVAFIPARISLEVSPVLNSTDTPYQRVLRLAQKLAAEGKRADLAEMSISGGPMSITKAQLVFNLWAGEEPGEIVPRRAGGGK